jgi:penicillin-binding protein 1C
MQAVRLIRPHPKSLRWKFKEAVMALKMERAKDKRWILSQYLNRAPFGSNFIGIEAAANGWFGKGAKQLGLGEAAMLAGMVQAPSRFRPDRGFERAIRRRDYVLGRMKALGIITGEQMRAAQSVRPVVCRAPRPFRHPYFCDWALRRLGRDHAAQRQGGDYVTTLDADAQAMCEHVVAEAAKKGGYSVAAVVMRVDTGAVTALACSGDYLGGTSGQVNTALAPRPAGSTLKPFLVAYALDRGFVTPEERLADVPTAFKGYRPANFDARHRGLVTLRDALVLSLNVPFVRLLKDVGLEGFGGALRELGFVSMKEPDDMFGLGMAIGNVEVSLLELVAAYGTIARGGVWKRPCAFMREMEKCEAGTRVFSAGASWLVSDMLSGDERSAAALGHVADVATARFAWKTGTSAAYRDAWTVAWNPEYVVGVWCGHVSGGFGDTTLVGAKAAAPLVWRIARSLYPGQEGPWFVEPGEVTRRRICSLTGLPANTDCPVTEDGHALAGRSRTALCPVHCRDLNGNATERLDAAVAAFTGRIVATDRLVISRPEDGAMFRHVPGGIRQRIVCQVAGNPDGAKLWWFMDGTPIGESVGIAPFAIDPNPGRHMIVCATAEGVSAAVTVEMQ